MATQSACVTQSLALTEKVGAQIQKERDSGIKRLNFGGQFLGQIFSDRMWIS